MYNGVRWCGGVNGTDDGGGSVAEGVKVVWKWKWSYFWEDVVNAGSVVGNGGSHTIRFEGGYQSRRRVSRGIRAVGVGEMQIIAVLQVQF